MRRGNRDPERIETVKLLDAVARKRGMSLSDTSAHRSLMQALEGSFSASNQVENIKRGLRVEAMFAYVAGALGNCLIVKEEDAGDLFFDGEEVVAPDYQIITKDGEHFFVEVKNCHEFHITDYKYKFKPRYLNKLKRYAALFGHDLKVAIYWSSWNLWCLVSVERFTEDGKELSLSFQDCFRYNEMLLLGDGMLGVNIPIEVRIKQVPKTNPNTDVNALIPEMLPYIDIYCKDKLIRDPLEKKLAFFLMLYNDWETSKPKIASDSKSRRFIQIRTEAEPAEGFNFALTDFLSRIISQQYNLMTVSESAISRLAPSLEPKELGIIIPLEFRSPILKLKRFLISPVVN
jgi:hypothetical protein